MYHHHSIILITLRKCLLLAVLVFLLLATSTYAVVPQSYAVPHQFTSTSNFDNYPDEHQPQNDDVDVVSFQARYNSEIDVSAKMRRQNVDRPDIHRDKTDDDNIKIDNREDDSYHATILRSLEQKHHIEYQYDQITYQHDSQQRALNSLSRILTRMEHKNNMNADSNNHVRDDGDNDGSNINNSQTNRNLQNEFENAFNTGRPGSTYGYNMFCGSSWAEASTSCPQRQNCPSGQTSECIMPGHECWAFTECDTRRGDGEQFSEFHNVVPGENLSASGVGAAASGGYVDLSKPSVDKTDHYFCGTGYEDARTKCGTHCPSGNMNDCPYGEICFTNTPCDARMMTIAPAPLSPTNRPTTPAPVVYSSKINRYYCGYDWDDAQERCEVWCPSGSDDDCPGEQLCMAFTECHAVDMNGKTLDEMGQRTPSPTTPDSVPGYYEQIEGGTNRPTRNPTKRPTKRPVLSAEQAMHRYSFCGRCKFECVVCCLFVFK